MADKKITELTELTTGLDQDDLLVVVDNPGSVTPITKNIKISNLFGGATYVTSVTTPAKQLLQAVVTANAPAISSGSISVAGRFEVNATAQSTNTEYQYAITATSKLGAAAANVTVEHAAAKFVLDVGNSAAFTQNSHVLILKTTNSATRVQNTQSFIGMGETSRTTDKTTVYLFDIGLGGTSNVSMSTSGANATTLLSNTSNGGTVAATHKLKIRVNGVNYWILLANSSASNL